MVDIKQKNDCCGCGACYDTCPKDAIIWESDEEGYSYPRINLSLCINCGLCNKVCPIENSEIINNINSSFSPLVFGCYHKDKSVQFTSTSGGAFWGLAYNFVTQGGYVAGAIFNKDFSVSHIVTNEIDILYKIKGSKYAQSDTRGMFVKIKTLLNNGEKVMATGLPCQMAALRRFLRKEYDNLIIVDLICHSIISSMVFKKYIEYLEDEYKSKVVAYHPKNKEYGGWHNFAFKATFENGKQYVRNGTNDYFTELFVGNSHLLSRPSCFTCHYKHFPQPSDITIGDFWGIDKIDPSFDSPDGISKVVINTPKGMEYFNTLDCFVKKQYDEQISVFENVASKSMIESIEVCDKVKRESFVRDLHARGFKYSVEKYLKNKPSIFYLILRKIKCYVRAKL